MHFYFSGLRIVFKESIDLGKIHLLRTHGSSLEEDVMNGCFREQLSELSGEVLFGLVEMDDGAALVLLQLSVHAEHALEAVQSLLGRDS